MILHVRFSVCVSRNGGGRNRSNDPFRLVPVVATIRRGYVLVDCAGRSIQREGRWLCIGDAVPGTVKAESGVGPSGGDVLPRLAGLFAHSDVGSALRYGAIPGTTDGLSIGKGPGQRPVAQSCGSIVLDGDGPPELAGVLRRDRVGYRTSTAH